MASKYITLTGICKWARPHKLDEKYRNWSIVLYPDQASIKEMAASGIQLESKTDEDGVSYKFRRPEEKIINKELVRFDPPAVVDSDGKTPFDKLIGNGSNVTIKVVVYDTIKGKGHRWEAVRVNEWVEYIPPEKDDEASTSKDFPPVAAAAAAPKGKSRSMAKPPF